MAKKTSNLFIDLSWDDLREWAGSKILSRGRSCQRQNLVSQPAITGDEVLIAWVDGTHRYATKVTIDEEGLPNSICTCPYGYDCKHGVAVVLEYLEKMKHNKRIPKASTNDERFSLFDEEEWDDELDDRVDYDEDNDESSLTKTVKSEIGTFLKDKTKVQLIELIYDLAGQFPRMAQELTDRKRIVSGDVKSLVKRVKKNIREISYEPGWQNKWQGDGYTPDYSEIRIKLETLLTAGHADEVVALGRDLIEHGIQQVEQSHDDGETGTEIEECMPILVKSLDQSTMEKADKLAWAVDVVLKDDYGILDAFGDYLCRRHTKADWNILADRLLKQLGKMKHTGSNDEFHRNYERDQLSNWVVHALERAGREGEIIPLCEVEAQTTGSYNRLVEHLISAKRYAEAEHWIQEGIRATEKPLPGIASNLRQKLKEIRVFQKDWPTVAVMQTEEFVRYPSQTSFTDCQKVNSRIKTWPQVREHLLAYLENGKLPWKQKGWPLPKPGKDPAKISHKNQFPMTTVLIDIAIQEKKPDQVLSWYDQVQKKRSRWSSINDDEIAVALQNYAPERAIAIWKRMAESLINQVKPSAYEQAASYLRKAEKIVKREKKQTEWNQYLHNLKSKHARKRRLMEILDQSDSHPIINKTR